MSQQNTFPEETFVANLPTHPHSGTCHKGSPIKICRLARPGPGLPGTSEVMLKRMTDEAIFVQRNTTAFVSDHELFIDSNHSMKYKTRILQ